MPMVNRSSSFTEDDLEQEVAEHGTLQWAIDLQKALFEEYSRPEFQIELFKICSSTSPNSLVHAAKLDTLYSSVNKKLLPAFGFTADDEGELRMVLALAEFQGNVDLDSWTAATDDLIHNAPVPDRLPLKTKKDTVALLRSLIGAFRAEDFQVRLRYLKAAAMHSPSDDCYKLEGRSKLALKAIGKVFESHGFDNSERGQHDMVARVCEHVMDPWVALYINTMNLLLGMESTARSRFLVKMRTICAEDTCPKPVKRDARDPAEHQGNLGTPVLQPNVKKVVYIPFFLKRMKKDELTAGSNEGVAPPIPLVTRRGPRHTVESVQAAQARSHKAQQGLGRKTGFDRRIKRSMVW